MSLWKAVRGAQHPDSSEHSVPTLSGQPAGCHENAERAVPVRLHPERRASGKEEGAIWSKGVSRSHS